MKEKGLKFKEKKTRYPYGIFVVSIFLILTGLAQSTLTITDNSITDSTNGILIDIANDYISFNNATFTSNISIGGNTITSSNITGWDSKGEGDFETTKIMNSKGNNWTATWDNFQLAVYDLNSTDGGTVRVPVMNVSGDSTIKLIDNLNIIGCGNKSLFYLADSSNVDVFQINSKSNILIEKIAIHANTEGQGTHLEACIDIEKGTSQNITIRDCFFYEGGKSLIDCQEGSKYITVESCHFFGKHNSGYGGGIWFSGSNCIARNNYIQDTYGCGIVGEAENAYNRAQNLVIDGNIITGEIGHGINLDYATGTHLTKASNSTIINNIIHDINSTAYFVSEGDYSVGILACDNTTISNNIVRTVQRYGMRAAGDGVIITDNKIHDVYDGWGVFIESDSGFKTNALVQSNTISNTGSYGIYASGKARIDNNEFTGTGSTSIYCKPTSDSLYGMKITNNDITNSASSGIYLDGFSIQYEDAVISNNYIDEVASIGIWVEDTSNVIIQSNIIHDSSNSNDAIRINDVYNCSISFNDMVGFGNGVEEMGNADYNRVLFNSIESSSTEIILLGSNSRVNCTGFDDWNFYDGVS